MANPWDFDTPIWYEHILAGLEGYPTFEPDGTPPVPPTPSGTGFTLGPDPSGMVYDEYYLYSNKSYEMAPSGVSFYNCQHAILQNAPVVVTPSGYETTYAGEPWARVNGQEKYSKVGFGYFDMLPNGQYNPDAREFAISPDASGKLVFNGILKENVYVEYEAGASGYYILEDIDYNPIRAEVKGGFVHFSQTTEPASLALTASQNSLIADGYQGCTITASLYDVDFDMVPNKAILFEVQNQQPARTPSGYSMTDKWSDLGYIIPNEGTITDVDASGYAVSITEVTNKRGECHVQYLTHLGQTGVFQIKAHYVDPAGASGIYDLAYVAQFYLTSQPFTLDVSLLDTLDYLT